MHLICKNNISKVYDDGEVYRMVTEGKEDTVISKDREKAYPLALCLKWGFEPIDIDYLNNLSSSIASQKNR